LKIIEWGVIAVRASLLHSLVFLRVMSSLSLSLGATPSLLTGRYTQ